MTDNNDILGSGGTLKPKSVAERQAEEPEAEEHTPGWSLVAAAPSPVFVLCNEENSTLLYRQRLEPDDD